MSDPLEEGRLRAEAVDAALGRARDHGRAALGETIAAIVALLDAATLAVSGESTRESGLRPLAESLERLRRWLEPGNEDDAATVLEAVREALDDEIRRWEERSREDAEARTILRAFLAVREVLWELGRRPAAGAAEPAAEPAPAPGPRREAPQRVRVEG